MIYITLLLVLAVLFLIAELVLLPGVSIGAILSIVCYGLAIYLGFTQLGTQSGVITIIVALLSVLLTCIICMRAKTWRKLELKQEILSTSLQSPCDEINIGDCGTAISRISPMGKVEINGKIYEAKSADQNYIDQKARIEVTGFENFNVIVKKA
ncbi:MAG: NfeD family protein [Alistipes sp.]|nr:NfeD family protein [Candidatus Alistipes equi]